MGPGSLFEGPPRGFNLAPPKSSANNGFAGISVTGGDGAGAGAPPPPPPPGTGGAPAGRLPPPEAPPSTIRPPVEGLLLSLVCLGFSLTRLPPC